MASDLLGIAVSGLRYSQAALGTTGHNIANAATEGYSRQRTTAVTNPATFQGGGYTGNGVSIDAISRVVNDFVTQQLRTDSALFAGLDTFTKQMNQMNGLLANASTGLSGALESFFAAVQNGANDPTSIPARELILSEAENLADRFTTLHGRFQSMHNNVQGAMEVAVNQVNALAGNIAELNRKIADATGNGATPNDLLDQRDEALRELSKLVSIRTLEQDDGQVSVIVGKGQNLVIGSHARELGLEANKTDPTKMDVVVQGQPPQVITGMIESGELQGLVKFRDEVLDTAFNELGRVAVVLADEFNRVHQEGVTLDNVFGGLFFADVNDPIVAANRVTAADDNGGDLQISLNIEDTANLEAAEYQLIFDDATNYRILRVPGNQLADSGTFTGSPSSVLHSDELGFSLNFVAGVPSAGDSFSLQPVKQGAQEFAAVLEHPQDIAMASPLTTVHANSNTGSGRFDSATILDPAAIADMPLVVEFTSDTTYQVYDANDPYTPIATGLTFTPGVSNAIFSTTTTDPHYTGLQAQIGGNPAAGDRFTIDFNSDGGLDNRNALALANLQAQATIGGTASFAEGYGALVEQVGIQTSSAQISRDAAEQVLGQTQALRESASGVNLDEEAANLIRFEQLFSANAQVISVARELFDQLISSF